MRVVSLLLAQLISIQLLHASTTISPLPIGNFALPRSQQPGAFYSFGSNILEVGQAQLHANPDIFKETRQRYIDYGVRLLYGTSESTSLLLTLPMSTETVQSVSTSGFGNFGIQGEYQFYRKASLTDVKKASIIASFTPPTGNLGTQAYTYFIGGVYNQTWLHWLWYTSAGISQFIKHNGSQPAPRVYYELGAAKNLASESGKYIVTGFLEVNGQYDPKNPTDHPVTRHSGGSVLSDGYLLFFSPSLFLANQKWILQIGVSIPIDQHWLGTRDKVDYFAAAGIAYTIN